MPGHEAGTGQPPIVELGQPVLGSEGVAGSEDPLRARIPQPPLTPADITRLGVHRGMVVTPDQVDGMNAARAAGIHTSIV